MRAALKVFLDEGYARASVDTIAAEAGVSKRTMYDYYGGKERLFLSAVAETRARMESAFGQLLDETLGDIADAAGVEPALRTFGRAFATEISRSNERAAILRLMIAEVRHFPALLGEQPTRDALAGRLAALDERGLLAVPDPDEAAEFLGLLVTGPVQNRTWYGAVAVDPAELEHLVDTGVRIFLAAYAPRT
ncbi:TetR/AcrR family transcriptional regulator [Kribbella sp. WER1]